MKTDATHPNAAAFPGGMSGPALRALAAAKIRSMADVSKKTSAELAALHGMGLKGVRMLADALALQGLRFRER